MAEQVDVVVIGLGPGGEEVAGKLAEAGLSVLGVERELVGGECPYWGCVPSKMMIRAANLLAEARRVDGMAGQASVSANYDPVAQRIREEATDDWDDTVAVDRLLGKGGRFVRGAARISGPDTVAVDGQEYSVQLGIVVATGTAASVPPIPGLVHTPYWTNRQAVEAKEPPASLIVLGGGAVGVELAQSFARFGTRVSVIEAAERLLPLEEPEAGRLVADVLTGEGLTIRAGATATAVTYDGQRFTVSLEQEQLHAEQLLVATGRRANLSDLGLDTVGADTTARWLETDEHQQVNDRLWAVGDVTGKGAFTHVAMYQAGVAVRSILSQDGPPARYHAVPRVTFTDPEIGAVGQTEAQARSAGLSVCTGAAQLPSSARGWIHKAGNDGFIKLVQDAQRGVLVGATSAGPAGGEVLGALALAVHAEVPTRTLAEMIYAYPTFHRGIEDALRDLHQQAS